MMDGIEPRFEFRLVAPDLEETARRLCGDPIASPGDESLETYLLVPQRGDINLKIRDGALDLKLLLRHDRGLEQWRPGFRIGLPASSGVIQMRLAALTGRPLGPRSADWDAAGLVHRLVADDIGFTAINVFKRRWRLTTDDCQAEIVDLWINGARQQSIALEAAAADAVLDRLQSLDIADQSNVNYVLAIERVLGQAPLPPGVFYNAGLC
jgi:hypothetical protein